jgi:hypothetical protein
MPEPSGPFGLLMPTALPWVDDRMAEVLRALGRLEFMLSQQIRQLIYPDTHRATMYRHLRHLLDEELIWRMPVTIESEQDRRRMVRDGTRRAPPRPTSDAYGLSLNGRTILDTLQVEHDQGVLERLKARDLRGRRPSPSTMAHDLQVSWWCSSVVLAARRHPHCQRIFVQVEYVVNRDQRIDAVVILRFDRSAPRPRMEPHRTPWFDGTPRRPGEIEIRLALEVDKGTEPLTVILGKADTYRKLTAAGVYNQLFGGPVLPVFLVPDTTRAAQIAREWRDGWPGGWGVIAVARASEHPEYGCLWGNYRTMVDAQPFVLLSELRQQGTQVEVAPTLTLEQWAQDTTSAR